MRRLFTIAVTASALMIGAAADLHAQTVSAAEVASQLLNNKYFRGLVEKTISDALDKTESKLNPINADKVGLIGQSMQRMRDILSQRQASFPGVAAKQLEREFSPQQVTALSNLLRNLDADDSRYSIRSAALVMVGVFAVYWKQEHWPAEEKLLRDSGVGGDLNLFMSAEAEKSKSFQDRRHKPDPEANLVAIGMLGSAPIQNPIRKYLGEFPGRARSATLTKYPDREGEVDVFLNDVVSTASACIKSEKPTAHMTGTYSRAELQAMSDIISSPKAPKDAPARLLQDMVSMTVWQIVYVGCLTASIEEHAGRRNISLPAVDLFGEKVP